MKDNTSLQIHTDIKRLIRKYYDNFMPQKYQSRVYFHISRYIFSSKSGFEHRRWCSSLGSPETDAEMERGCQMFVRDQHPRKTDEVGLGQWRSWKVIWAKQRLAARQRKGFGMNIADQRGPMSNSVTHVGCPRKGVTWAERDCSWGMPWERWQLPRVAALLRAEQQLFPGRGS